MAGRKLAVLLLGSGGREHALAWKLSQSPRLARLVAAPGSAGLSALAACVPCDPLDPAAVVALAKKEEVGLVVVGPEAPLAAGVADALRAAGIPVFGPGREGAKLESSKAHAKDFMRRHRIPTARYEAFTDLAQARAAADAWKLPVVVKADGLAAGKGVVVCASANEALGAVTEFMERQSLGAAGKTLVLEDGLSGPELSVMAVTDGKTVKVLPPARDHKRVKDGDLGPNTGGMGAYAPVPVDDALMARIKTEVLDRAAAGLKEDGVDYRGVLYAGLMLTPEGPMTLEFNCRFGDPETQAVLPLVSSDLLELLLACAQGRLSEAELSTAPGSCLAVTLASEGYPGTPKVGRAISGLESVPAGVKVFHSGTTGGAGAWTTAGGRVLTVSALGADLPSAREKAYAAVKKISFEGMHYRTDIAAPQAALKR